MKNKIKTTVNLFLAPFVTLDFLRFKRAVTGRARFKLGCPTSWKPQIKDKTVKTGFDRHYVYHTSWAARVLAEERPEKHVDIASSLFFVGVVSAFIPIEFYDYRPADLSLYGLQCKQADLLKLPFETDSLHSLSCMHVVEHIGLGRYGDTIDPDGDIRAAEELSRVLAPGGNLLIVVPIGKENIIEWNAHRIYTYEGVLSLFPNLSLREFALIPETFGPMIRNATPKLAGEESYACGCFLFTKPKQASALQNS